VFFESEEELLILLFAVLLVQDAITLLFKTHAAETIFAGITVIAIKQISVVLLAAVTSEEAHAAPDGETLVTEFRQRSADQPREITIGTVFETLKRCPIETVLAILQVISFDDILAIVEIISDDVLTIETVVVLHDFLPDKCCCALPRHDYRSCMTGIER